MLESDRRSACEQFARRRLCGRISYGQIFFDCTDEKLCELCAELSAELDAFATRMQAETLREAAQLIESEITEAGGSPTPYSAKAAVYWLRVRASQTRNG